MSGEYILINATIEAASCYIDMLISTTIIGTNSDMYVHPYSINDWKSLISPGVYFRNMCYKFKVSSETVIHIAFLASRAIEYPIHILHGKYDYYLTFDSKTAHFYLTALLLIISKFWDDNFYDISTYCEIIKVTTQRMKMLEAHMFLGLTSTSDIFPIFVKAKLIYDFHAHIISEKCHFACASDSKCRVYERRLLHIEPEETPVLISELEIFTRLHGVPSEQKQNVLADDEISVGEEKIVSSSAEMSPIPLNIRFPAMSPIPPTEELNTRFSAMSPMPPTEELNIDSSSLNTRFPEMSPIALNIRFPPSEKLKVDLRLEPSTTDLKVNSILPILEDRLLTYSRQKRRSITIPCVSKRYSVFYTLIVDLSIQP